MRLMRAAAIAALFFASASSLAQELWGGNSFGMSRETVRKLNPAATTPANPSTLQTGAKEVLEQYGVPIGRNTFTARFYFKEAKLHQITLELQDNLSSEDVARLWDELYALNVAQYGKESSLRRGSGQVWGKAATWAIDGKEMTLFFLAKEGFKPIMNIVYQSQSQK